MLAASLSRSSRLSKEHPLFEDADGGQGCPATRLCAESIAHLVGRPSTAAVAILDRPATRSETRKEEGISELIEGQQVVSPPHHGPASFAHRIWGGTAPPSGLHRERGSPAGPPSTAAGEPRVLRAQRRRTGRSRKDGVASEQFVAAGSGQRHRESRVPDGPGHVVGV